jgi:branched-chain amino acid transport system ATP-binding protein
VPELLEVVDLEVSYGSIVAARDINFSIPRASVLALLGPNGAGKSSILKGIAGVATSKGAVRLEGVSMAGEPAYRRARAGIVSVPQGRRIFREMTVDENLLLGLPVASATRRRERLEQVMADYPQLAARRRVRAGFLSGGEQQILALARAMMGDPKVVLLDEPSLGLAPKMVTTIFDRIAEIIKTGVAVILVDQNAKQAIAIADQVCVINHGLITYAEDAAKARSELDVIRAHIGIGSEDS